MLLGADYYLFTRCSVFGNLFNQLRIANANYSREIKWANN